MSEGGWAGKKKSEEILAFRANVVIESDKQGWMSSQTTEISEILFYTQKPTNVLLLFTHPVNPFTPHFIYIISYNNSTDMIWAMLENCEQMRNLVLGHLETKKNLGFINTETFSTWLLDRHTYQ